MRREYPDDLRRLGHELGFKSPDIKQAIIDSDLWVTLQPLLADASR